MSEPTYKLYWSGAKQGILDGAAHLRFHEAIERAAEELHVSVGQVLLRFDSDTGDTRRLSRFGDPAISCASHLWIERSLFSVDNLTRIGYREDAMHAEDIRSLLTLLEPKANDAFDISDGGEVGLTAAVNVSLAISLKRIADNLEAIRDAVCSQAKWAP